MQLDLQLIMIKIARIKLIQQIKIFILIYIITDFISNLSYLILE